MRNTLVAASIAALVLVSAFYIWMPVGIDFMYYRRALTTLTAGGTLYSPDTPQYFAPPWALLFFGGSGGWFPTKLHHAVHLTVSVLWIGMALRQAESWHTNLSPLVVVLALVQWQMFDLFYRGQIDAWGLLGVVAALSTLKRRQGLLLGVALVLLSFKPQLTALLGVHALWSTRGWPVRQRVQMWIPIAAAVAIGFVLAGWDWPMRYVTAFQASPPPAFIRSTLWEGASDLGIPWGVPAVLCLIILGAWAWAERRFGNHADMVHLSIAVALLVGPHTAGYHYLLLLPAVLSLSARKLRYALLFWLLQMLPTIRIALHQRSLNTIDVLFAAAVTLALFWELTQSPSPSFDVHIQEERHRTAS